jgi:hypothetical protein
MQEGGAMLTGRYMTSTKNLSAIMQKIIDGTAPTKFTVAHLRGIGFKSSNDQGVLPLLKDLGFLSADGMPTARYNEYRDRSRSKIVMGEALRQAYEELFHIKEHPTRADRAAIEGRFKSVHNASDRVAELQASTFLALLELADLAADSSPKKKQKQADEPEESSGPRRESAEKAGGLPGGQFSGLRYNIEVHLPATKDVEVYNAIFRSLRENLLED